MERCPVCRASFNGETSCRRCRADLSALLRIEREAEILVRQAARFWASGETRAAAEAAGKSLTLKGAELARVIRSLSRNDQSLS